MLFRSQLEGVEHGRRVAVHQHGAAVQQEILAERRDRPACASTDVTESPGAADEAALDGREGGVLIVVAAAPPGDDVPDEHVAGRGERAVRSVKRLQV